LGTGFPGEPLVTNTPAELERAKVRADALFLRIAFQATHPDFRFRLPWETTSGMWEVETPKDGVLPYGHAVTMMDDLEMRYPE
jgi:hypothetical protein